MIIVTDANGEDAVALAKLLVEMDDHYDDRPAESVEAKTAQINAVLFTDRPLAYALLARDGSQVIGLAAYSFLWPVRQRARCLYLKELYVSGDYRGQGIGKLLMNRLFEVAVDRGCGRVEWMTDEDNGQARQFYQSQGFTTLSKRLFYRANLTAPG